jgi:hypothetical protein
MIFCGMRRKVLSQSICAGPESKYFDYRYVMHLWLNVGFGLIVGNTEHL